MQTLPLIGGSYSARSVIANAQRCLNLYPEANRKDSPAPVTHYQRPGLVALSQPSADVGRGIYQASNGDGYIIVGSGVYFVDSDWTAHLLGSINNEPSSICSMVDNGQQLLIVNGVQYAGNATGSISFASNPSNGDTITLDGTVWTFVSGTAVGNQTHIGGTLSFTMFTLQTNLNASTDPNVSKAAYSRSGAGPILLDVVAKTPGASGTFFTLAASAGTPSGAHLVLGGAVVGEGWIVDLGDATGATFTAIVDASWTGADRVDYIDTFIVWNVPGTNQFMSTTSNTILPIDPTYVAAKTNWPDPVVSIIVNREQILVPGRLKSELWYDAGNPAFPFARLPGTSIEHGVGAKYSLCSADLNVYWLAIDIQGQGIVLRQRGNETKRISNYALEYQMRLMAAAGTISDAVGYTYQIDGHLFYVLSFPSGNQTWVWDESVGEPELGWSQRGWTDTNGRFNRDRGVLGAMFYGVNVVLDWEHGTLYQQDPTVFTDTVLGVDYPISYLRTFPHLMSGVDPSSGQPTLASGQMVMHERFQLDAECGNASGGLEPVFSLRWSDDRGKTWGNAVLQSAGEQGKYVTRPNWNGLGQAMDRVYEVSWTFSGQVALNGAWVQGKVTNR